jgi:hypothetical protein
MKRSILNFRIDVIIAIMFVVTSVSFRNYYIHITAGLILILGLAVHLYLHWKWIVVHIKRRKIKLNFLMDSFIGIMLIISSLSGFILIYTDISPWSKLHIFSSVMLLFGTFCHLILHWRWILKMIKKILNIKKVTHDHGISIS